METITAPVGHPARAKITVKGSARQYKVGPKPTGRDRLTARAVKLQVALRRFAAKATTSVDDHDWAIGVAVALQTAGHDRMREERG